MIYKAIGETNVGRVRDHNEDAFLVSEAGSYFLVSDGMGGLAAGEVASAITKEAVKDVFGAPNASLPLEEVISQAIQEANRRVREEQDKSDTNKEMGATCVILAFRDKEFSLGFVGDSRVYLFRKDSLKQLTRDHSYVEELYERGLINESEKANHPFRNSITRYIGNVDEINPEIMSGAVHEGDVFILCSDGLTNELEDSEIEEILKNENENLKMAVDTMIQRALEHGGKDNVSIVIVKAFPDEREPSFWDTFCSAIRKMFKN